MVAAANPAVAEFVARLGDELLLAQVVVRRVSCGFELRHIEDRGTPDAALKTMTVEALREIARNNSAREFRPLKCAPNLVPGWRVDAPDELALGDALERLYPGGVADWFAARVDAPPVTHYREFTARQTGMYRITAMLDDAQVAVVIQNCCDARRCLKQRLWSVAGLATDEAEAKCAIPCLEPCAVLLEAARRSLRAHQEEQQGD